MPRDGSGVYTLPSGNPVVTGTIIASTWANTTLSDIAAQLNNVLTRDGLLGPTGPFKLQDGTVAAPGLAWVSEPGLGFYRNGPGNVRLAAGGANFFVMGSTPTDTNLFVTTRSTTPGNTQLEFRNTTTGQANYGTLGITLGPTGAASIGTNAAGTATRGNLTLDAPQVTMTGGLSVSGSTLSGGAYPYIYNAAGGATGLASQGYTVVDATYRSVGLFNLNSVSDVVTASAYFNYVAPATFLQISIGGSGNWFRMNNNGQGTSQLGWTTVSDGRVKVNRTVIADALAKVRTLTGYVYDKLVGAGVDGQPVREAGLIAQDVEAVVPETVTITDTTVGAPEGATNVYTDMRTLNYDGVVALLVNAVNELDQRITQLETA
jgi:hypothetical protein